MKKSRLSRCVRNVAIACLALFAIESRVVAQQGAYITQAATRLGKLVDKANTQKFTLQPNSFSIGGGWLKKGDAWVSTYAVQLYEGKQYRFLAAGDNDARDVDLRVTDLKGEQEFAADVERKADAVVNFSPKTSGRYLVQIRLASSREGQDAVCLSVVMMK
jgi:hypothetical protein